MKNQYGVSSLLLFFFGATGVFAQTGINDSQPPSSSSKPNPGSNANIGTTTAPGGNMALPGSNSRISTTAAKPKDARLARQIRARLSNDPEVSAFASKVNIVVSGGVVTVHGTVPTVTDREALNKIISQMKNVTSVDDQLQVGR